MRQSNANPSAGGDRLAEAHSELVQAIESLTTGDDWRRMLEVAGKFHHYSFGNCMLIAWQCPSATRVAGYRKWQELGRQVRKGEKGIRIFAPIIRKTTTTDEATGETVELRSLATFRLVSVFDIAQTNGDELPDVRPELLAGSAPADLWDRLARQVKAAEFDLERGDCEGANGRTNYLTKTVRVRDDVDDAQAVKTLAHELAHVLLHEGAPCRGVAEVEAESVAYLTCQAAGLSTDGYSLPYVASWADGDGKVVQQTAERVITTARAILAGMGDEVGEVAA